MVHLPPLCKCMEKKKPFTFRSDTQIITQNMQRDFEEIITPQELTTVGELSNAKQVPYLDRLFSFLAKAKKVFSDDFIIEVHQWHEIGDRKVTRIRLRQLLALPTPRPGRSYYYYDSHDDILDLLWDLPPQKACEWAYNNRMTVGTQLPHAMTTILDYYDGTLVKKADEINKQIADKRSSFNAKRDKH